MTLSNVPATSWAAKWVPVPTAGSKEIWNNVVVPSANKVAQMLRTAATMESRSAETVDNASTVGSKWRTPVEEPPNEDPPQGQRSQHAASMTGVIQKARLLNRCTANDSTIYLVM